MPTAPALDEIEVSVFGPGYGECIVLHLGEGNWFIVDSCIDPETRVPVAFDYFRQIDVNPGEAIRQIIATHWRNDHIRGLAELVRECESAEFVCSAAINSPEFSTLVNLFSTGAMMENSGIEEFSNILNHLQEHSRTTHTPKLATADRLLWQSEITQEGKRLPCAIHALSPSDRSITLSTVELARLIPGVSLPKRRLLPASPNHLSVVLWVQVGSLFILLGADLQETNNPEIGWSVIVGNSALKDEWLQAPEKASFFKIPHHGSENGDYPDLWEDMLNPNPIAVLTPFTRQGTPLPTRNDVDRICARTDQAFSASTMRPRSSRRRDRAVERTIRETVGEIRQVHPPVGQVRCRTKLSEDPRTWEIELLGSAVPLDRLYAA